MFRTLGEPVDNRSGLTGRLDRSLLNLMVKYKSQGLDAVFSALGDPTRRAILARLARGGASVGELAAPHEMSLPAVSKHLRVLESAGLLRKEKDGRVILCRLEAAPLRDAAAWIAAYQRFWEAQFDALAGYLERLDEGAGGSPADDQEG